MKITKIVVLADSQTARVDLMGDEAGRNGGTIGWGWSIEMARGTWALHRMLSNDSVNVNDYEVNCVIDDVLFLTVKEEMSLDDEQVDFVTSADINFIYATG